MDPNIFLGGLMVVYGIVTLVLRQVAPHRFWKLEVMKKKWGERAGVVIHVLGYTVLPLVVGAVFLVRGLA